MKLRKIVDVVVAPKMYLGAIAAAALTACGTDSPTAPTPDSVTSQPAVASSTPPVPQEPAWELIALQTDTGTKWYFDPKSTRTEDGRFVSVREATQEPFADMEPDDFVTVRDCKNKSARLVMDGSAGDSWRVTPGSLGAIKYNTICEYAFGAGGFARVDE